jgi:hypothetical protein
MELALAVVIFWILIGSICLGAMIFWVWMLVHAAISKTIDNTEKIVWVLIILFTHFLGALIYFFVRWIPDRNKVSIS